MIIATDIDLPEKPVHGAPCNGCGYCCQEEICEIGQQAFPDAMAPCPAIVINKELARVECKLVIVEKEHHMKPLIHNALGIGKGCCSN